MKNGFVSKEQLELLPRRLLLAGDTNASKEFDELLTSLKIQKKFSPFAKILVIGSGGSYPAAVYAKYVISEKYGNPYVEAVTPHTARRMLTQFDNSKDFTPAHNPSYDLVIGISYSGKTHDIIALGNLCAEKGYPFVLITGAEKKTLKGIYSDEIKIISYFNPDDNTGKEKGMISMFSTLAPVFLMDSVEEPLKKDHFQYIGKATSSVSHFINIKGISSVLKESPIIHVFYEWDTYATAADIESKFIESGLATVILHEKKNFTHGRYTLLYKQQLYMRNFVIIDLIRYQPGSTGFNTADTSNFQMVLSEFLRNLCWDTCSYYLAIGSKLSCSSNWNAEVLTLLPYLITGIGEELGIDISKPFKPYAFPAEAKNLYNYIGPF